MEYPEKKTSEQGQKLTFHMMPSPGIETQATMVGGERSHHCAIPAVLNMQSNA